MPLAAGTRLGPYEIHSVKGAGGMGEVHRATDTRRHRTVALNVLPPVLADARQFRERFERRAMSISQFSHPTICALHDIGRESDLDCVMECLEGETLAARLKRGPLPLSDTLRIATEIASALHSTVPPDVWRVCLCPLVHGRFDRP